MRRRGLLLAAAAGATAVAGLPWAAGPIGRALAATPPDDAAGLPADPAVRALLDATWDGLDATRLRDTHVHLLGSGDAGRERPDWTTFQVPDAYAAAVAASHPDRFDGVASVHPYAEDAAARVDAAAAAGAVAMKWLPSAMNIDLADRRCEPVYARLRRHRLPLIVHVGDEHAVPGAGRQGLGHPLALRHPLDHGLTVIAAHCASLGDAPDTDRRSAPARPAFELFARLMDERARPGRPGRLLGDVSGVFQRNRAPAVWRAVLARRDWHDRLVHGSDHPLPGVVPLFSPSALAAAGLLADDAVRPLETLRRHHPLLFDLALKRHLHADGVRLPASVFEARALAPEDPRPIRFTPAT